MKFYFEFFCFFGPYYKIIIYYQDKHVNYYYSGHESMYVI